MSNVQTEGQWINGAWVPVQVKKGKSSEADTSMTSKARLQDTGGLGAAAAAAKSRASAMPRRANFPPGEEGDAAYQAAYDAWNAERLGKPAAGKPKTMSFMMAPPQGAGPMYGSAPSAVAQQMLMEELQARYGNAPLVMGGFYNRGGGGMA